jgi:hypothetical protein
MTGQNILDEIGKTIRDGNPRKRVYICSDNDNTGQLVDDTNHNPPDDFVWFLSRNNPGLQATIRYDLINQLFGEQIGDRRIGNVLQIVEFKDDVVSGDEIGWDTSSGKRLPQNTDYKIEKITQFSVLADSSNNGASTQLRKRVIDNITYRNSSPIINNLPRAQYFPCRNMDNIASTDGLRVRDHDLLPQGIRLSELDVGTLLGAGSANYGYFVVEGCDDISDNIDTASQTNRHFYPDYKGPALTCSQSADETVFGQSVYSPIIRVAISLEGGRSSNPKGATYTRSIFRTTFQTRRIP